jgi:isoleucyl-tRNA synthetase
VRLPVSEGRGALRTGDYLLIWTTTPWTLPGNLAVAVGEDIDYVAVENAGSRYWVAAARVGSVWREPPPPVALAKGRELVGATYRPPFGHFARERARGAFRVIPSFAVTVEEGTGLVHMAPAYGEADFDSLRAAGIEALVDPIDLEARFTDEVPEVAGKHVKEADPVLIRLLEEQGLLVRKERIRHSYPFCYRTDTPLIYKAIPTWFVRVEQLRDRMVELNRRIHWVPEYVGSRRFGNWLEDARDWAISRNRYWGSCIPLWTCDRCEEIVCVDSIDKLEGLSGVRPTDLHRHVIDPITWRCTCGEGTMRRVPEVLDCWFESGSMPYAQFHYPFENKSRFERAFPANFIAEGLDQTRAWFYTLLVLAVALFDREPFRNCVVNGLVLAEDGRKMSKSRRNYPDPSHVLDQFGADALRAYLITSPAVRAEPLRFSEAGVREMTRTVLLPLWNAYSFFTTYAEADGVTLSELKAAPPLGERPEIDRWIISALQSLITEVNTQMEGYYLYAVIPPSLGFIDDLTNWYVRRSRRRFWRTRGVDDGDKLAAFATLYEVLTTFCKVLAPILPFITEAIYQDLVVRLRPQEPSSVHLCDFPMADEARVDRELEESMAAVRRAVALGHSLRKQHQLKVRRPLRIFTTITRDRRAAAAVASHRELIAEELNVKEVEIRTTEAGLVALSAKADYRVLGPRLGKRTAEVAAGIAALSPDEVSRLLDGEVLEVAGEPVAVGDVVVERVPMPGTVVAADGDLAVALDTTQDADLHIEGVARELVSRIQQLRRSAGFNVTDRIRLRWWSEDASVEKAVETHRSYLAGEVLAVSIERSPNPTGAEVDLDGSLARIEIERLEGQRAIGLGPGA